MRSFILISVILLLFCGCEKGGSSLTTVTIRKFDFFLLGHPRVEAIDTFSFLDYSDSTIDLAFLQSHVSLTNQWPVVLVDRKNAGKTICEGCEFFNHPVDSTRSNKPVDIKAFFHQKPEDFPFYDHTTTERTYDNSGKLISYSFSSCIICGVFPFQYALDYNAAGKLASIEQSRSNPASIRLSYDPMGFLNLVDVYANGRLDYIYWIRREG